MSAPFKAHFAGLLTCFVTIDLPIERLNQTLGQMSEERQPARPFADFLGQRRFVSG